MALRSSRTSSRPSSFRTRALTGLLLGTGVLVLTASGLTITQLWNLTRMVEEQGRDGARAPASVHPSGGKGGEGKGAESFSLPYEIRNFSVSLSGSRSIKHAQFDLVLECGTAACLKTMRVNRAKIRDAVIGVALGFRGDDFRRPTGSIQFREAILRALREIFGPSSPKAVAVNGLVMD